MTRYAITEPFLTKLIGLASYQLGRVARLMNPDNPDLKRLHYSAPDTAVLYPYYAKFAQAGDNTFFRHIDINIKDLAKSGRGANMIQGTVSLDDEQIDDCTMILPGMHKHFKEWEEVLDARGLSTASLVHRIKDSMFTAEDGKTFRTRWTPQPCKAGQVRVTVPHLPHGAYGPAKVRPFISMDLCLWAS